MNEDKCPCLRFRDHCGPCENGVHIFCNHIPHGDPEEAYEWFVKNPEITKNIRPLGNAPEYDRAIKEIERKAK